MDKATFDEFEKEFPEVTGWTDAPCYYNGEEASAWGNGYNSALDKVRQWLKSRAK